ncbi:hypothetical protein [Nocardia wallacei]|uniref:hypothetical protein n=1 Tax=Nocardia wallacei TaxID=480035 RepID=UPI0024583405|nr:hypothetical protein [Nocardia wallacei]
MTVTITQDITDIAGVDDNSVIWFSQTEDVRAAADGVTMISTRRISARPVSGTLTVQLEPGPCRVEIGAAHYDIEVPDINGTLLPLIEASFGAAAATEPRAVINAGGIARVKKVTESEYAALLNPDSETEYSVVPD